jgi:hypothetical protein
MTYPHSVQNICALFDGADRITVKVGSALFEFGKILDRSPNFVTMAHLPAYYSLAGGTSVAPFCGDAMTQQQGTFSYDL